MGGEEKCAKRILPVSSVRTASVMFWVTNGRFALHASSCDVQCAVAAAVVVLRQGRRRRRRGGASNTRNAAPATKCEALMSSGKSERGQRERESAKSEKGREGKREREREKRDRTE